MSKKVKISKIIFILLKRKCFWERISLFILFLFFFNNIFAAYWALTFLIYTRSIIYYNTIFFYSYISLAQSFLSYNIKIINAQVGLVSIFFFRVRLFTGAMQLTHMHDIKPFDFIQALTFSESQSQLTLRLQQLNPIFYFILFYF